MKVIQGPDLYSLHDQCITYILRNCYKDESNKPIIYPGENGQDTIEAPEVTLVCSTPMYGRRFIPPTKDPREKGLPFSRKYMDEYADQLIQGKQGSSEFVYDYHGRLRCWGSEFLSCDGSEGTDQITYIIKKLHDSPVTRRGIATTWYPHIDTQREDVPCLQLVHCTVRKGKLDMRVLFRSEDMLLGLGPNMYGLTAIQCYIANCLDIDVGTYTHIAFCPHLYVKRDHDYLLKFTTLWSLV